LSLPPWLMPIKELFDQGDDLGMAFGFLQGLFQQH
jgi:hypothetical protein